MDSKKIQLFENTSIPMAVAKLSIPAVMGTIVMIAYNLADTYFVGALKNPVETSAVTLGAPAILAFNAVTNLFGVGGSSMISRSLGLKKYDTVKKTSSFCFYTAMALAVLISVGVAVFNTPFLKLLGTDSGTLEATRQYVFWTVIIGAVFAIGNVMLSNIIRSEGESLHASIGVMSGCILNIILDPFFVWPQFIGMGASGAGMATCISNAVACLYLLIVMFIKRRKLVVTLNPLKYSFDKEIIREVFTVGIPASIQNLLNVTGTIVLNRFTRDFGPDAVAAMGNAHKVNMLPLYLTMGMTQGIMPLISYNYSSGNRKRMKDAIWFVLKLSVVIAVSLSVLIYVFADRLIRFFMDNDTVVMHGEKLLRGMSIGILFLAIDFLAVAVFQAIGRGLYSLIFAILRKVILEIPAIIVLNKLFPLYGMGYSSTVAEFILAIAAIIMLLKIFREKGTGESGCLEKE